MCKEAVHIYTHLYLRVDLLHTCAYMGVFVDLRESTHARKTGLGTNRLLSRFQEGPNMMLKQTMKWDF